LDEIDIDDERNGLLSDTAVIVLAAGQGTRMKSRRAKVAAQREGAFTVSVDRRDWSRR